MCSVTQRGCILFKTQIWKIFIRKYLDTEELRDSDLKDKNTFRAGVQQCVTTDSSGNYLFYGSSQYLRFLGMELASCQPSEVYSCKFTADFRKNFLLLIHRLILSDWVRQVCQIGNITKLKYIVHYMVYLSRRYLTSFRYYEFRQEGSNFSYLLLMLFSASRQRKYLCCLNKAI